MTAATVLADLSSPEAFQRVEYPSIGLLWLAWRPAGQEPHVVIVKAEDHHVVVDEGAPAWTHPVLEGLARLQRLPANWDSYGARPLNLRHREAALNFLGRVMTDDTAIPDIVPLADGGVQLEWRRGGLHVDFISDDETAAPVVLVTEGPTSRELGVYAGSAVFRDELRGQLRADEAVAA